MVPQQSHVEYGHCGTFQKWKQKRPQGSTLSWPESDPPEAAQTSNRENQSRWKQNCTMKGKYLSEREHKAVSLDSLFLCILLGHMLCVWFCTGGIWGLNETEAVSRSCYQVDNHKLHEAHFQVCGTTRKSFTEPEFTSVAQFSFPFPLWHTRLTSDQYRGSNISIWNLTLELNFAVKFAMNSWAGPQKKDNTCVGLNSSLVPLLLNQ